MTAGIRPPSALVFRAGPSARAAIRREGFSASMIGALAGASGGAKWLVLSQLDRVVARRILPELSGSVQTIATSIGAWRFACYAQSDPLAAIGRFEEAYLEQRYTESPDRAEITARSREILEHVLGDSGAEEILAHPALRTNILAVRSRHLLGLEQPAVLAAGLLVAATSNAVSRRSLGAFFERALFYDPRLPDAYAALNGFPLHRIALTPANLGAAILATGSIPLVLEGVRDIAGAPAGMYRDGGVIDYHLDFPHASDGRLALYLHFYPTLTPGWFDKKLGWRRPAPSSTDWTLLVSPHPEFVASLPNGKIPDRRDFKNYAPAERRRAWRGVVSACERLADEFESVLDSGRLGDYLEPL